MAAPEDLVLVGHITGAFGVHGWVKIKPYSADANALLHAKTWWLDGPHQHDGPLYRDVDIMQAKLHGADVVASFMGVADRNAAEMLKGAKVAISRNHFPALSDNEFYWVDLIGSDVENLQGKHLGILKDLMDNGAHPILQVAAPEQREPGQRELLIPFIDQFVKTVDQSARKVIVDWDLDY